RNDDTNQLVSMLRLSGIARTEQGHLRVRNRIYERVFDREWVVEHMPDAELRRQRAAYRTGLLRTASVASVIVIVMAALALTAVRSAVERQKEALQKSRLLYAADMNVALQAWNEENEERAEQLLDEHRPRRGEEDLRGFEWRYLWRECQQGA